MGKRVEYVEPDGHRVQIHLEHWLPRLLGGRNLAITVGAGRILVQRDWLSQRGLAHECGHVAQARRLGWRYLPAILWQYLRHWSTTDTPLEREADAWMEAHWPEYPVIGAIPPNIA